MHKNITRDNTVFVMLSFEGPDRYSLAGGLGARVSNLSCTLARAGFVTHLFFIGDPSEKGEEIAYNGKLHFHRWCQWISAYYPNGVYHGEEDKLCDFNKSAPDFIVEQVIKPAIAQGKLVAVLGEEWHTAETMSRISDLLYAGGIRDRVVLFWNANNTFSFERINWGLLSYTAVITTVSRYMKHVMRNMGINALVIPNGIPKSLLEKDSTNTSVGLRDMLGYDLVLSKVARWDPDKRWLAAVEVVAGLKARGIKTLLLARGGIEPHGEEVLYSARSLGLNVKEGRTQGNSLVESLSAIESHENADILDLKFHCFPEFLRIVYNGSDAVLANSGHEPFGLVGLETMAAGGVAFTGGTGEDYAVHLHNSIVLETPDPQEIEDYIIYLEEHVREKEKIRSQARRTARLYTWEEVTKNLIEKLEYQARSQGILKYPEIQRVSEPVPENFQETGERRELVAMAGM